VPSPEVIGFVSTEGGDGPALDEPSTLDELSIVGEISLLDGMSVALNTLWVVDSAAVVDNNSDDAEDEGPVSGVVDSVVWKLLLKGADSALSSVSTTTYTTR
jgi:hypothetical protein